MSVTRVVDGKYLKVGIAAKAMSLRAGTFPVQVRIVFSQNQPEAMGLEIMDDSDLRLIPEPSTRYTLSLMCLNGAATLLWEGITVEPLERNLLLCELNREVWIPLNDFEEAIRLGVSFTHN